ncbi:ABC transporter ATP-binding protein [Rufibacter radiotolerans]|uniref:ABC transporter ATP-binding protein n=1 Tax=Rufibacter radiotolerans TaxID=1379910 RepID=UPI000AD8D843|nr:ABC transporter ATP-binding protein [Rufibacter radiotolerans]
MTGTDKAITVQGLTKRFGDFTAVDGISFEVEKGEIFGFLGANGAGKTTAIRMLCGLSHPTSGQATVAGYDVYRQTEQIKRSIGYMSQKFSLYGDLTVRENIRFFAGIYGKSNQFIKDNTQRLLQRLHLQDEGDKLVRSLPLGWKQKLAFSVAIFHEPEIVFLDEPTGGVDPVTRREFWQLIYEAAASGITVFVTTHYMDEAEYCNRVSIMVDGRIDALDTPQNLKQQFEGRFYKTGPQGYPGRVKISVLGLFFRKQAQNRNARLLLWKKAPRIKLPPFITINRPSGQS